MVEVYNSKDLTLEICKEIKKLAKEAKACKDSYVPFIRALRKKDLEECVAIINGELSWLQVTDIVPYNFIRNGRYIRYYSNGQKWVECIYVNGNAHGKYEVWYENGQKRIECNYVNDKLHGKYEEWYENGQKWVECTYVNGISHLKYELWYPNGRKRIECNYVNGVRVND